VAVALLLGLILAATNLQAFQAHASSSEPLLPNLVADPPDNTSLATDSSTGTAKLLLRFNGYVHNIGPGALDFRGTREAPKVSQKTTEEVEHAREHEESPLPQKVEEELATPPMKVFQRLYTTNEGKPEESEKYLNRPHLEEPSPGEMIYVNADGHHHWHLQKVARYSLWNATKTAEVAPAQKVGFCLEDSQHVETSIGPKTPVYADNVAPYRDFCQQYRPNATSVYEGISPGWRDVYSSELAFQWVDVSDVLPGEYWLREDVNPLGIVKEAAATNAPAYSTSPTIVPGFDAQAQTTSTKVGEATTVGLAAKAWNDTSTPKYAIVSQPKHGKLGTISKNLVTYTPEAGYSGTDSFTFSVSDPNSQFPESPATATVSIEVSATGGTNLLLAGSSTATYSVGDQTTAGREEAFQFTAKTSGTVEELQFRTDATADTGLTGVILGVLGESAGKPGEVLGAVKVSGQPGVNSWIKASGVSVPMVSGTNYWLVVLPLGPSSAKLYYDAAAASGGTGDLESDSGGLSALAAEAAWEAYNQGPVGFQAIGSNTVAQPSVTIEGAPASMVAGTGVQLSAHVSNDSPSVTWKASAGSITTGGLYTAPSEPPSGGVVTVTATTSKGAHTQVAIEITSPISKGLLAGSSTATYSVGDQTTAGREEAFQFTAKTSGTVEELQFRTDATADTGLTGVILGVLGESAGKPGEVLGAVKVSGQPGVNSWIKASGVSVPMVSGTNYWLVVLPLGPSSAKLYYDAAAASGGTGDLESDSGGLSALAAEAAWEAYNQGPVGFQAIGSTKAGSAVLGLKPVAQADLANSAPIAPIQIAPATARVAQAQPQAQPIASAQEQPNVAIAGAQARMIAGTSIQLSATVANDAPTIEWSSSAGTITSSGLYTAPGVPPSGKTVTVSALTKKGAHDRYTITILPVPVAQPAPVAPLSSEEVLPARNDHAALASSTSPAVAPPEAVLVGRTVVLTTGVSAAGRVRLSAYAGKRRLGSCAVQTPADRSFTCEIKLGRRMSLHASLRVVASLRAGDRIVHSLRPTSSVSKMKMNGVFGETQFLSHGHVAASWRLICGSLQSLSRG
jgi:Lysyl oxidase/Bacterial Ig domain